MATEPKYLTAKEAAYVLRVSVDYVRALCKAGELDAFRVPTLPGRRRRGGDWRIQADEAGNPTRRGRPLAPGGLAA